MITLFPLVLVVSGAILGWIIFIGCVYITVIFHELGHLISALLCKVKVEAFSIGFGKHFWHKKVFGIDFRISPLLLGGYVKLRGEHDKRKNGFLSKKYRCKLFIALSGIIMNFLIAIICYLINFKSISFGLYIDWKIIIAIFTKNYEPLINLLINYNVNVFLLQLSVMNLFCGFFNLLPIPALDGALIWLVFLKERMKHFGKFMKKIGKIGFIILTIIQIFLIVYILWR